MKNHPKIKTGQDYHHATSYDRHAMSGHYMDWQNMPSPYKSYPSSSKVNLIPALDFPRKSIDQVFHADDTSTPTTIDLQILSKVLALSYGFTAKRQAGGQTYLYRSAPSAGRRREKAYTRAGHSSPGRRRRRSIAAASRPAGGASPD